MTKAARVYIPVILLAILSASVMISCSDNKEDGIRTTITGQFSAFGGGKVSLSEIGISSTTVVDTAVMAGDGSFRFRFDRPGPGFYLLKVDQRNYLTLILDQEKKIKIASDNKELRKDYRVEGSADSELYRQFELFLDANRRKVDSLKSTYSEFQRSAGFQSMQLQLNDEYQRIFSHQRQYMVNYAQKNCSSLSSLLVINRRFGDRLVITPEEDLRIMQRLDTCLSVKYPGNIHVEDYKKRLQIASDRHSMKNEVERKLSPGNKAPDIDMEDPEGKTIKLYSLAGKPVIVYFWASWENNCKPPNAALRDFLAVHVNKDLQVYAVGLESYRDLWKSAIERDGTQNWLHVTDYLNIYSSAKNRFNVPDKLPYFYLLDKDLIIQYKGNVLQELFSAIRDLPS